MSNSAEDAKAAAQIAAEEAEVDALLCPQRQQALAGPAASADGKSGKKRRANRNSPPPKKKRTRHSDDAGDISRMKASELRAELEKLGLGTKGIKAVLVARLTAAIKAGAGAPATAASDPAALLSAFDFELSQELKARMLGRKAKWLVFKHRYDRDFSTSHLFARAIREFGCYRQDHALASSQALAVLSAELPDLAVRRIRQYVEQWKEGGRLVWDLDLGALVAAGWDKKRIRAEYSEYLHRPEVSAGKNGTLRMLVENAPGTPSLCNERAAERIVAVEGGDLTAAAARARATLGLTSLDTSKPHTLTIKVSMRAGWSSGWSSRCIGLMQVPNDASVEELPDWISDLDGNDCNDWRNGDEITVTDPNVAKARQSILSMGPRRPCCYAGAPSQRQHEWDFPPGIFRDEMMQRLETHAWDAPDVHRDIIDRLQAFDRNHVHKMTARLSGMDTHYYEHGGYSPGEPARIFELRNRGGRTAVCKYVKENLPERDDCNGDDSEECRCLRQARREGDYGTQCKCIRDFQLTYPCTIEDLLPTMEETMQPSQCPAASLCRGSGRIFISSGRLDGWHAPTAVYANYELTVIAQTERLTDESKYPKLSRNGNVAAATATW